MWNSWWNENWQGKPKYSEKTYPSVTLSPQIPCDMSCARTRAAAVGVIPVINSYHFIETGIAQSVYLLRCGLEDWGIILGSTTREERFLFFTEFRPDLGATQLPNQWAPERVGPTIPLAMLFLFAHCFDAILHRTGLSY
jgi:hypothetical protein